MKAVINLTENASKYDCVELEVQEEGVLKKKTIKLVDFLKIAQNYFNLKQRQKLDAVILPPEAIAFAGTEDNFVMWLKIKKQTWYLTYHGEAIIVDLPELLVRARSDGKLQISILKDDKVIDFDFPNMLYGGGICYGSFPTRHISPDQVMNYFYEVMSIPLTHSMPKHVKKKNGKYVYQIKRKNENAPSIEEFIHK